MSDISTYRTLKPAELSHHIFYLVIYISPHLQNPVEGKVATLLNFKPQLAWPSIVPSAASPLVTANLTTNDTSTGEMQYFVIEWTITCNGNTKKCDTTIFCELTIDCGNQIGPIKGWSSAMYPFDKVGIILSARYFESMTSSSACMHARSHLANKNRCALTVKQASSGQKQ